VFAGSSVGNTLFNLAAWPAQTKWCNRRREEGVAKHLEFHDPVSGTTVNTSPTIFADDCGSSVTGLSIEELLMHDKRDDAIFDNELAAVGMRQCVDKAVRQIALFGEGDGRVLKSIANNNNTIAGHTFVPEARYLGPYLHICNGFDNELDRRLRAMGCLWWVWRRFWTSSAPFKLKKMIFKSIIISTLFYCAIAYVIHNRQYKTMETAVC
jgi:hypothetical protein